MYISHMEQHIRDRWAPAFNAVRMQCLMPAQAANRVVMFELLELLEGDS
jgi:hypothetical protein